MAKAHIENIIKSMAQVASHNIVTPPCAQSGYSHRYGYCRVPQTMGRLVQRFIPPQAFTT